MYSKKKIENSQNTRDFDIITGQPKQRNQASSVSKPVEETKNQSLSKPYGNNQNANFDQRNASKNNFIQNTIQTGSRNHPNPVKNSSKNAFPNQSNSNPLHMMSNVKKALVSDRSNIQLPTAIAFKWDDISKILNIISTGTMLQSQLEVIMTELYSCGCGFPFPNRFKNLITVLDRDPKFQAKFFLILPFMAKIALSLPSLFGNKTELKRLVQYTNDSITLTKAQICCLLAHMFFGTVSNDQRENPRIQEIINFQNILCFHDPVNAHKLLCILNYFQRMMEVDRLTPDKLCQEVRFSRKFESTPKSFEKWLQSNRKLTNVYMYESGVMEDLTPPNSIHVDFANKFIGGGVLTKGAVQEEIRFLISPECLVSLMIFECFEDNEVGYIIGTEKMNKVEGYAQNMRFSGDYERNNYGYWRDDTILAMDAIHFMNPRDQYAKHMILRELNKAFLGFDDREKVNIITGKWGCGAFKGDPQLKFVIQWLACSEAGKEMHFCSLGEKTLKSAETLVKILSQSGKKVKDVVDQMFRFKENGKLDLFEFLASF